MHIIINYQFCVVYLLNCSWTAAVVKQSDGSAVWVATPGHDISALQASSFYNLPPHQHLTFAPSQASHGAFPGIYHPTPTVTPTAVHPLLPQSQPTAGSIEMVGPPAGVYQQPQRGQINWANTYWNNPVFCICSSYWSNIDRPREFWALFLDSVRRQQNCFDTGSFFTVYTYI